MNLVGQFSQKERAVIELLLQGKSNKQIAYLLHTAPRTIEYHLTNIYSKLGVGSRAEAIILLTKNYSTSQVNLPANDLRESTVVPPLDVHDNTKTRTLAWRQSMKTRKILYIGFGLIALICIGYLIFTNLPTSDTQIDINAADPEISLVVSSSPTSSQPELDSDEQLGLHVLVDFLTYLYQGDFEKAAQLYGGTYEAMIDQNPQIDPANHVALLKNACTINGMLCMRIHTAGPTTAGPFSENEINNRTEFKYQVEFLDMAGSLYVLGPCCGASATDSPPQSIFYFNVVKGENNTFLVMDMPPYSP
jgi:DNA-binding CsgD family transcriptional regulator